MLIMLIRVRSREIYYLTERLSNGNLESLNNGTFSNIRMIKTLVMMRIISSKTNMFADEYCHIFFLYVRVLRRRGAIKEKKR